MTAKIAGMVIKQLAKKLILSGIIIAICILVMQVNQALGVILMMFYSSWMVIKSSSKEMPLSKFTALLPGLMSLSCFLFMLLIPEIESPVMPLIGIALGLVPGFLMAKGHRVYEKNGRVFAKRTFFYIFIWALSLLFTQGSTLLGLRKITEFGLLLNGFSTTMAVILSAFLFSKALSNKSNSASSTNSTLASLLLIVVATATFSLSLHQPKAFAVGSSAHDRERIVKAAQYVFNNEKSYINDVGSAHFKQTNVNNLAGGCEYQATYKDSYTAGDGAEAVFTLGRRGINAPYCDQAMPQNMMSLLEKQMTQEFGTYHGNLYYKKKKHLTNGGRGFYLIFPAKREYLDDILTMIWVWEYEDFFVKYQYVGVPSQPGNLLGGNPVKYIEKMIPRIQKRVKAIANNNFVDPSPSPDPTPSPDPVKDVLEEIRQALSGLNFSDEAAAAGVAAALVQLLAGLGMGAAMTAAQEAANAFMAASQEAATDSTEDGQSDEGSDNTILDGADAMQWMKDNGYFDENGQPTEKYHDFVNSPPSQPGPGLQGFAGDVDENGNPTGNFAIIFSTDNGSEPSDDNFQDENNIEDVDETDKPEEKNKEQKENSQPGSDKKTPPVNTVDSTPDVTDDDTDTSTKQDSPPPATDKKNGDAKYSAAENNHAQSANDDSKIKPEETQHDDKKEEKSFLDQLGSRASQDLSDLGLALSETLVYSLDSLGDLFTKGDGFLADVIFGTSKDDTGSKASPGILKDSLETAIILGNLLNGKTAADIGTKLGTALGEKIKNDPDFSSNVKETLKDFTQAVDNFEKDAKELVQTVLTCGLTGPGQDQADNLQILKDTAEGIKKDLSSMAAGVKKYLSDPDKVYDGIKSVTGVKNFENSWDPDRSVGERLTEVAFGTLALGDTISGLEAVGHLAASGVKKVASSAGSLVDDGIRAAATAVDKAGDLKNTVKAADTIQDAATDTAAVLNRVDDAHDTARDVNKALDAADNTLANKSVSSSNTVGDDVAELVTESKTRNPIHSDASPPSSSDELLGTGSKSAPDTANMPDYDDISKKPEKTPTTYDEYLERNETRIKTNDVPKGTTTAPGNTTDFVQAGDVPDTSGYTQASQKHLQTVADKYGVKIHGRPTNPAATALLESGEALPKPQLLKNKTIGDLDTYIGFNADDIGKVGHGKPVTPDWDTVPESLKADVKERYAQRAQEFIDQKQWLAAHKDQVRIQGNLIVDARTGKPFTGDVDLFDIRGMHGEPLPASITDQVTKELKEGMSGITENLAGSPHKGHSNVMHGRQTDWDYSKYDDKTAWDKYVAVTEERYGVKIDGARAINPKEGKASLEDIRSLVINGTTDQPPSASVIKQIQKELKDGIPFTGKGRSKYAIAEGIDKKIRASHTPTAKDGEALVTYSANMDPKTGSVPNPTASYYTGGKE